MGINLQKCAEFSLSLKKNNNCADAHVSLLPRNDCMLVLILQSNIWEQGMTIHLQ